MSKIIQKGQFTEKMGLFLIFFHENFKNSDKYLRIMVMAALYAHTDYSMKTIILEVLFVSLLSLILFTGSTFGSNP